ncbi:hypothetical protein RJT34_19107 [Clitoria ternatea]|uniref:Uncharacterized protein n=1 Tax=Clitoria ternatea TaxID=43366 RepID=A0AAN9IQE8_CLITE
MIFTFREGVFGWISYQEVAGFPLYSSCYCGNSRSSNCDLILKADGRGEIVTLAIQPICHLQGKSLA